MISNPVELKIRRRQIAQFIREDPTSIRLVRREKIELNGGWKWGPEVTLPEQITRIVPAKRRYGDATTNTEAGQVVNWPYILLGRYDMDIQEGDTFTYQGERFQVKSIEQDRDERTAAFLDYFGG